MVNRLSPIWEYMVNADKYYIVSVLDLNKTDKYFIL